MLAAVFALTIPTAGIVAELAYLSASSLAMACCRAASGECAGWKAPHECCETRDSRVASIAPAPLTHVRDLSAPLLRWSPVDFPIVLQPSAAIPIASLTFKRPHDPPHLHAFSLVI
jgi:hypothetical protein